MHFVQEYPSVINKYKNNQTLMAQHLRDGYDQRLHL